MHDCATSPFIHMNDFCTCIHSNTTNHALCLVLHVHVHNGNLKIFMVVYRMAICNEAFSFVIHVHVHVVSF